ncbi:MAG TPA: hypothetical protein VMZ30_10155 [Pyrinomonadaceae bacterium]|nr:hypothetical protein [Pyrinomonadaceae bacterium]
MSTEFNPTRNSEDDFRKHEDLIKRIKGRRSNHDRRASVGGSKIDS